MFSAILPSLLLIASTASALRVQYTAHITSPTAGQVWYKGDDRVARVKWDTSLIPPELRNHSNGTFLKLAYIKSDQFDPEVHLTIDLAKNLRIGDGYVYFPLPWSIPTCKRCVIKLDSGNISPEIEIRAYPYASWPT